MNGGINTYGYVGGNPLSYADPEGLSFLGDVGGFTGGWGGRVGGAIVGEAVFPAGGGVPGAIIGGRAGAWGGRLAGEWLNDLLFSVPKLSPADEAQKDRDHDAYHNTCDKQVPPPNLTPCEEARWRYRQAKSCQRKRSEWEERWGHPGSKAAHERALENVKLRLKNAAEDIARFCVCGPE